MQKNNQGIHLRIALYISLSIWGVGQMQGQALRYFRFRSCDLSSYNQWRDTSFVAATADSAVIQQCLAQLALPEAMRSMFPAGTITAGSGGYNRNGDFCFGWHFVEDGWALAELAIEVCDGCPYTDVEQDLPYWTGIGYCGWGNTIAEELTAPAGCQALGIDDPGQAWTVSLYPNPAQDQVQLSYEGLRPTTMTLSLFNSQGQRVYHTAAADLLTTIGLTGLPPGIYRVVLVVDGKSWSGALAKG